MPDQPTDITRADIQELLPHRPPMLLIDSVVSADDRSVVCRKRFRAEEYFFQGHYPGFPIVPGVVICECAAQAGAVLIAATAETGTIPEGHVPVLSRLHNVRFRKMLRPGDTIDIEVSIDEFVSKAWFLSATVRHEGKVAATLEFACTTAPRPAVDPASAASERE